MDHEIIKLLKKLFTVPVQTFVAKVISVDEENMTIEIDPEDQAAIDEVRLKAAIDGITDGIVEIPATGSTVLCGVLGNDKDTCYLLKCSKVDKILINGNVIINNGENGGLTITPKLVEELNKTNQVIEAITQIVSGPQIPEPGNSAPSALQAALATALTGKQTGDYSGIENDKIVH